MKWTLTSAAREFGFSKETLSKALLRIGQKVGGRSMYTGRIIFEAMRKEDYHERVRGMRLMNDKLEREEKIASRELMRTEDVDVMLAAAFSQLSERINSLADDTAHLCNTATPMQAHGVLTAWSAETRKLIRKETKP